VGEEGVIVGLSDVIIGMSKGGKRRALVPPRLGYTPDVEEFAKQVGKRFRHHFLPTLLSFLK